MSVAMLRESFKDYARDIKLNLGSVLTEEGSPGMSTPQIWGVALASAYYTKNSTVIEALTVDAGNHLSPEYIEAAKAAATIMAMNNIYYRFVHLAEDQEIGKLPARLRMNVIGKPGIDKVDFEMMSLAVSALEGCGACVNAHARELSALGSQTIQSVVRIAATVNGAAQAVAIGQT